MERITGLLGGYKRLFGGLSKEDVMPAPRKKILCGVCLQSHGPTINVRSLTKKDDGLYYNDYLWCADIPANDEPHIQFNICDTQRKRLEVAAKAAANNALPSNVIRVEAVSFKVDLLKEVGLPITSEEDPADLDSLVHLPSTGPPPSRTSLPKSIDNVTTEIAPVALKASSKGAVEGSGSGIQITRMDEYSALRDAPYTAADLEELTDNMCEPRVVEVNSREPELRSGRTLRGAKHAKLAPRIEQHYPPLAGHVMGLFRDHKAGVPGVAAELVFILRCLKLAESKCGSYLPAVLEKLETRDDDEVQLVGSSSGSVSVGKAKAAVIELEHYIIECLIVGEEKLDPKELDALAAKSVEVKAELEAEALPQTAVLVLAPPPVEIAASRDNIDNTENEEEAVPGVLELKEDYIARLEELRKKDLETIDKLRAELQSITELRTS